MTLRELRSGDSLDQAMTRAEYYELRDADPRPWPEPVNRLLEAIADVPDDTWRQDAACHPDNRTTPTEAEWAEIFYPDQGGHYDRAQPICDSCPVRAECLKDGKDEIFGMWGGVPAEARQALKASLPPMTRHGYPFGAQAHRRRGETPCQECMDVQRRYDLAYRAKRKQAAA